MKRLFLLGLLPWLSGVALAAIVYSQPHNGGSALYQSSVNGTDYDQMTWDSFRLTNAAVITEIHWRGGYIYGGTYSGAATNWTVAIYGDIANGYQPDILNPPIVSYTVSGNMGQTNAGTFGGTAMFEYSFTFPSPFSAGTNQYYWVLIQANQAGIPEWGIAAGSGGNGSCFRRIANVGDWWFYRASGDAAFTLVASDAPTVSIAASASPSGGGTVIGAGNYPLGSSVSLRAAPAAGYALGSWTQNGAQVSAAGTYTFTATTNRTLVANFVPAYTVAVSASPSYAGVVSGGGTVNSNAMVTVTAADVSGFQFVDWTEYGSPVSTLRSYSFPAAADRNLVANYAFLPQTAVFDFDTGVPAVGPGSGMPGSQSNRSETAYFTALNYSWSIQNTIYGWVSPLFSGNFLYPSTGGATLVIQFIPPVTNITLKFVTADLTTAGDVRTTVRATGYTNSLATTAVGSATAQGSQWVNGPYPDGTLTFGSATPFDFVKLDFPSGQPSGVSYLLFVDNIVVQQKLATPTDVTVSAGAFPDYAGTTSSSGTVTNGATVTVSAAPASGFAFVNWTEAGAVVSSTTNYTFIATKSRTVWANFTPLWNISATASPGSGGSVAGTGIFTNGANVTLTATSSNWFFFLNWTDGGTIVSTATNFSFVADSDHTLVANFAVGWNVTTSSSPGAGGTTSGGGGYTNNASVTVNAVPNASYAFVVWKDGASVVSTLPGYTFTVMSNRALTATFVRTYTVTTLASPVAGGALSGQGVYTNGSSVTVRAWVNPGYLFANWTEGATVVSTSANYTFTLGANRTLTANFLSSTPSYSVAASAWPDIAGTVGGGGIYTNGANATLTAVPNPHFAFSEWTENGLRVSTSTSYSFTVASNRTLVANFTDTNPPPVANGGHFYQITGQPLAISIADLLYNDYDVDGDPVTLFSVGPATTNGLVLATTATQIFVPANSVADSFAYTITDGYGSKGTGTVIISIITNVTSRAQSPDLSSPGGVWVGFTGVPWYFYEAQRATNVMFSGAMQLWPVQAWADGTIFIWDDFADLPAPPREAFYRLRYAP